jgi:hypothetical protein
MMVLGATMFAGPALLLLTRVLNQTPLMGLVHQSVMVTQLLAATVRSIQRVQMAIIAPKPHTPPVSRVRLPTTRVQHTQLMVVVLRVVLQMLTIHLFWT